MSAYENDIDYWKEVSDYLAGMVVEYSTATVRGPANKKEALRWAEKSVYQMKQNMLDTFETDYPNEDNMKDKEKYKYTNETEFWKAVALYACAMVEKESGDQWSEFTSQESAFKWAQTVVKGMNKPDNGF